MTTPDPQHHTRSRGESSAVVGMIGGGQLARMTHQAAIALGIELIVLAPSEADAAVVAGAGHVFGHGGDLESMFRLAERCDVVTLDHELVDDRHLQELAAAGHVVRPGVHALELAQDKALARRVFADSRVPVPRFEVVAAGDLDAVQVFAAHVGWPLVLKEPTGGYDGRGVQVIDHPADLPAARPGGSWLLEERVPIARELAVLIARRPMSQGLAVYPVVETTQIDGICHELAMPAPIEDEIAERAVSLAVSIAEGIDAVGIIAVELFLTTDGQLLVNEIATRPHNSGHATIDACVTSQFENHLRAVLDWPLGDTSMRTPAAVTVNLLGTHDPFRPERVAHALTEPDIRVHVYGKQWAPGRKLGHVTALASTIKHATAAARAASHALEAS